MTNTISHQNPDVPSRSSTESRAIYAALVSGAVGFIVALIVFRTGNVTLFERGVSIGFMASILGGIVGLVVYLLAATSLVDSSTGRKRLWSRITTWSLALVHGLLAFLFYVVLFYIISQSFLGAQIDAWSSSLLVAVATGLAAYVVYLSALTMNALRVSLLLATFLLSGVFISMLTASDPYWWDIHFSSLGASGGVSGYAFNATLIIAGLVIVALTSYIIEDFQRLLKADTAADRYRVRALQVLLSGIGVALAGVGIFVCDAFPVAHNIAAGGMAVLFIIMVVGLPWLTPSFPRAFFVISSVLLSALLLSAWLFMSVQYLSLTVFELVAAALIFSWLVVFVRHIAALVDDGARVKQ